MGYEILPLSRRHSFVPQIQLSFPICLFLLSLPFRLLLISCFELHPAFNPLLIPLISIKAYLLFTAPRGYLSFSLLHCECHGDTRIPQSAGPDPPPAPPESPDPSPPHLGRQVPNILLLMWKHIFIHQFNNMLNIIFTLEQHIDRWGMKMSNFNHCRSYCEPIAIISSLLRKLQKLSQLFPRPETEYTENIIHVCGSGHLAHFKMSLWRLIYQKGQFEVAAYLLYLTLGYFDFIYGSGHRTKNLLHSQATLWDKKGLLLWSWVN